MDPLNQYSHACIERDRRLYIPLYLEPSVQRSCKGKKTEGADYVYGYRHVHIHEGILVCHCVTFFSRLIGWIDFHIVLGAMGGGGSERESNIHMKM